MLFGPPRVRSNISASESNSTTIPNQELATSRLGGCCSSTSRGSEYQLIMALCIECSPAVQEVPGSIPDCHALIASRSGPSLLSSECSPTLYAEDVGGPGQAPTGSPFTPLLYPTYKQRSLYLPFTCKIYCIVLLCQGHY
jgi:hypothetical protein